MSLMVQLFEFSESERRLRDLLVTLFQEVFLEFFPGKLLPWTSADGPTLDLHLTFHPLLHAQVLLFSPLVPR